MSAASEELDTINSIMCVIQEAKRNRSIVGLDIIAYFLSEAPSYLNGYHVLLFHDVKNLPTFLNDFSEKIIVSAPFVDTGLWDIDRKSAEQMMSGNSTELRIAFCIDLDSQIIIKLGSALANGKKPGGWDDVDIFLRGLLEKKPDISGLVDFSCMPYIMEQLSKDWMSESMKPAIVKNIAAFLKYRDLNLQEYDSLRFDGYDLEEKYYFAAETFFDTSVRELKDLRFSNELNVAQIHSYLYCLLLRMTSTILCDCSLQDKVRILSQFACDEMKLVIEQGLVMCFSYLEGNGEIRKLFSKLEGALAKVRQVPADSDSEYEIKNVMHTLNNIAWDMTHIMMSEYYMKLELEQFKDKGVICIHGLASEDAAIAHALRAVNVSAMILCPSGNLITVKNPNLHDFWVKYGFGGECLLDDSVRKRIRGGADLQSVLGNETKILKDVLESIIGRSNTVG